MLLEDIFPTPLLSPRFSIFYGHWPAGCFFTFTVPSSPVLVTNSVLSNVLLFLLHIFILQVHLYENLLNGCEVVESQ